ncbi:MAG: GTPase Era [Actinomycetota bacterium]|nr:GTPase Era [Actinomycetota bacterium]
MTFRSGFVCLVGRPNTGKSTLLNALVGTKVAITSDKPQTTRSAVRGIMNVEGAQVVFIDTPGYHKPRNLLGQRLNEVVRAAWSDVDLCVFLVDASAGVGRGDERIARELSAVGTPVICAVNKVDIARREKVVESLAAAGALGDFAEYVPVSALAGEGVDLLRDLIVGALPDGPMYYPEGTSTDQPPPVFVAELVREKLLARTHEELPHSIAVTIEDYEERADGLLWIQARIFVERSSQKGIVIGKGGRVLKEAGIEAREEVEALFGRKVYLDLQVKVEKDWQRRAYALDRLGFGGE